MKRGASILLLALMLSLSLSGAVTPGRAAHSIYRQRQGAGTGQISGVVTDNQGEPLADIIVDVYQDGQGNGHWQWINSRYTDAAGLYTFCCLAAGVYRIGFSSWVHYPEYYDNAATLESATDIMVTAGAVIPINAQLAWRGRIRGRVTDMHNGPLKGIWVTAYTVTDSTDARSSAITDSNGAYMVAGLTPGGYHLEFLNNADRFTTEYYQNAATIEQAKTIHVNDNLIEHIDAQLAGPTGRIQGVVTNESNELVREADIVIYQDYDQNNVWDSMTGDVTDANGVYMVTGLRDGAYRVEFFDRIDQYKYCPFLRYAFQYYPNVETLAAAADLVIQDGNAILNINARLTAAGQIQGRVTDVNNNPVPWLWVVARSPAQNFSCFASSTDGAGVYHIGVADGVYRLLFSTRVGYWPYVTHTAEYYDNAASFEAATDISVVQRGIVTAIDAQLAPAGTIRGLVTDVNGVGLAQIKVIAYRDTDGGGQWQPFSTTETDRAGAYGIPGVGGNDEYSGIPYRIGFTDLRTPAQYHANVYPDAGYPELGQDIRVSTNEEVLGINVQLAPSAAVNLAPLAHNDQMLLFPDQETARWLSLESVLANDRDAEVEPISAVLVDASNTGTVTLDSAGTLAYLPTDSAWVSDTFTYRAHDQQHESNVATVTIWPRASQFFLPLAAR